MPYTFIISDQNVIDADGERVMVDGIDLSRIKKNPVCLYMHNRHSADVSSVIGRWDPDKFRTEEGQLLGDVDFDLDDERGAIVDRKVKGGFLSTCSPRLLPVVLSDDPDDKLEGQERYTYLKSVAIEISITDIPSNENAVRVKSLEMVPSLETLMKNFNTSDPPSGDPEPNNLNQNKDKMDKEVLKALGLDENASETEALAKIEGLKSDKDTAEKSLQTINDTKADQLVERGVSKGLIEDDADAKKSMKEWFLKDLDAAEKFVGKAVSEESTDTSEKDGKPKSKLPEGLQKFLDKVEKNGDNGAAKKLSELTDEELEKMDEADDERLRELFKAEGFIQD